MDESASRLSRLRALQRLLDYAIAESRDLEMSHIEHLLGATAVAIGDMLDSESTAPTPPAKPARRREIRLVVGDARHKNGNDSKN